jgi:hypothetical protein
MGIDELDQLAKALEADIVDLIAAARARIARECAVRDSNPEPAASCKPAGHRIVAGAPGGMRLLPSKISRFADPDRHTFGPSGYWPVTKAG